MIPRCHPFKSSAAALSELKNSMDSIDSFSPTSPREPHPAQADLQRLRETIYDQELETPLQEFKQLALIGVQYPDTRARLLLSLAHPAERKEKLTRSFFRFAEHVFGAPRIAKHDCDAVVANWPGRKVDQFAKRRSFFPVT